MTLPIDRAFHTSEEGERVTEHFFFFWGNVWDFFYSFCYFERHTFLLFDCKAGGSCLGERENGKCSNFDRNVDF